MHRQFISDWDNNGRGSDRALSQEVVGNLDGSILPLTSPQREIWFDQMLHPDAPIYNIGGYWEIPGSIDPQRLEHAVRLLAQKHDCLRTILIEGVGEDHLPKQVFAADLSVDLPLHDFSQQPDPKATALEWMERQLDQPFDLYGQKLFAFDLLNLGCDRFYLFNRFHHIIIDAWGIALLGASLGEVYTALAAGEDPDLSAPSYKDFIHHDRSYVEGPAFQRDHRYWLQRYKTVPNALFTPRQDSRSPRAPASASRRSLFVAREKYECLKAFADAQQSSPFQVLLAVMYVYLARSLQLDDITLGLPILNRPSPGYKATAGLFVGASATRLSFSTDLTFAELVQEVRRSLRQDYRHQRLPLSELSRALGWYGGGGGVRSLFNVAMSYERHRYFARYGSLQCQGFALRYGNDHLPLNVTISEGDENEDVLVDFVYNQADRKSVG